MLKTIGEMFRSDEFISSSAVFPEIDRERISKTLRLTDEGDDRGKQERPEADAETLDHVELQAISRVEELRRRGLENYETNRRVYLDRLNLAGSARMQVETDANDAKSKFVEEITKWRGVMVTPRERVQDTFRWRDRFRDLNKLERPAQVANSMVAIIGLAFIMIVLESAGNAYLFSQKNTLGILGGLMAAFLVSLGNVSISTLLGMATRYINCRGFRNLFKKFSGLLFFLLWVGFAAGYNLAVAHFRDAVERIGEWREAGTAAIQTLVANPISLYTMESYVLLILGAFISIIAFLKGYNALDPYPGYSKVAQDVIDARDDYVDYLEESIDLLAEHRDEAVGALRQASDEVHRNINDSVDALYGQKALQSNLGPFLEQCDLSANYLLAVYRDANKSARTGDAPKHFKKPFAFEKLEFLTENTSRKEEAEAQVKEVIQMVNDAISEIFEMFHKAVLDHYEIDELEGTYIERSQKHRSAGVHSSSSEKLSVVSKEKKVV